MARKKSSGAKTKRNRQAVAKIGPKTVQRGETKRMRPSEGQKWPEKSPAGQKLSEIGKRWPKLARKQSSGGKLSGCGQALGKTKRMRPIAGQKWPENCPAGQKLSEIGKRSPKLARKQSSGALRIYASM